MNKIKHRDHLSIHDEVARVAQLLSDRLITSDHRSNETNDYCRFDLAVNCMCQLRRSHGKDTWDHSPNRTHSRATLIILEMHVAACARDSVSSARCWFLQLSADGCDWLSQ